MNKDIKHATVSITNLEQSLGSKDTELIGRASTPEGAPSDWFQQKLNKTMNESSPQVKYVKVQELWD